MNADAFPSDGNPHADADPRADADLRAADPTRPTPPPATPPTHHSALSTQHSPTHLALRLQVPRPVSPPARSQAGGGLAVEPAEEIARLAVEPAGAVALEALAPVDAAAGAQSLALDAVLAERDDADERAPADRGLDDPGERLGDPSLDLGALAQRLAAALQPAPALLLAAQGPLAWPQPLLPYQLGGVRELLGRNRLLLADDMGLGKTVQATAALRVLLHRREIEAALIALPAGLLTQWRRELARWAPELRVSSVHGSVEDRRWQWRTPAHVYLTSYETLRADFTGNPHAPVARLWDLVILDEAQRIRNAATDLSRACKRLRRRRGWALTGTPLENRAEDLASLLEWLHPGAPPTTWVRLPPAALRDELRMVQLRRRKADVLDDLPPKLVGDVLLPLGPAQRRAYERAEREGIVALRARGEAVRVEHVLELIVRLKQLCNFCPVTGESSKLDHLREHLAELGAQGHKALVFTQFANATNGARAIAARLGASALVYTGDLSAEERDAVLQRFRTRPERQVLILSLRAGGQGLNLQEASYVFHFDRWWNPSVESQAEARSHRLGQTQPVNVYTYTCERTIEERIAQVLAGKRALFNALVDEVSLDPIRALADDSSLDPTPAAIDDSALDLSTSLNSAELFGLFDLHPPGDALIRDHTAAQGIDQ